MLDDEVETLEIGGGVVDVGHVERVLVQRPDRGALVDVDVLDPEVLRGLQEPVRLGVGQLVAAGVATPFGGVELHALVVVLRDVGLELTQPVVALARVEPAVDDQPVAPLLQQRGVLVGGVEAVGVPLAQVRRLEDRVVDMALDEHVALEVLGRDLEVVLVVPVGLGRTQLVVAVEAVDPALRVLLGAGLPVLPAGVPEVAVGVDDEVLLSVFLVHVVGPLASERDLRDEDRAAADPACVEIVERVERRIEGVLLGVQRDLARLGQHHELGEVVVGADDVADDVLLTADEIERRAVNVPP